MSLSIAVAPIAVQAAFSHVEATFPGIDRVSYDNECRWTFLYPDGTAPSFSGHNIDLDILEKAADAQYNISVPVTYKV